jgi:multiple sugar transport system permease protein/raffinose/stachyose/melibiose transport system permease protein
MFEARRLSSRIVLQAVLTIMVLPFLFPLISMVQESLAGQGWGNYKAVWDTGVVPQFFRNSIIIAAGVIIIVYCLTMLSAFGFAKLHIRGREIYFWMMLAALTMPEVVLLTPLFSTAIHLNLYNTYFSVILPLAALQIPFCVLLTRNFVNGIPDELFDAARVDGASAARIFWSIIVPLTRPMAAAIIILTLIGAWNDYLLPLVFLQTPATQTITLLPSYFVSEFSNDQTKVVASAVITAIPEIIAYLCLQGLFERGLTAGALK